MADLLRTSLHQTEFNRAWVPFSKHFGLDEIALWAANLRDSLHLFRAEILEMGKIPGFGDPPILFVLFYHFSLSTPPQWSQYASSSIATLVRAPTGPLSASLALQMNLGSVVRLARDLDTLEPVAVKVMNLKKHGLAVFEHEVAMLRVANHENSHRNVPRLLGHVESGDKGFLVLEYLPFPTLSSFIADIGALGFDSSVYILYQIVREILPL